MTGPDARAARSTAAAAARAGTGVSSEGCAVCRARGLLLEFEIKGGKDTLQSRDVGHMCKSCTLGGALCVGAVLVGVVPHGCDISRIHCRAGVHARARGMHADIGDQSNWTASEWNRKRHGMCFVSMHATCAKKRACRQTERGRGVCRAPSCINCRDWMVDRDCGMLA